jgi:pyruvate,water dikinase
MKKLFNFFRKSATDNSQKDKDFRKALKDRYLIFQDLLGKNNQVLGLMADMEDKLSGESLFDKNYIDDTARLISEKVSEIIYDLNELSGGKYQILNSIYSVINKEIEEFLSYKFDVPVSDYTIPIRKLGSSMSDMAGGKISQLGEIRKNLNVHVPEGFVITAYAFKTFFDHNNMTKKIGGILSSLNIEDVEELDRISEDVQQTIIGAEMPEELINDIKSAYSKLCKEVGGEVKVSVRSSAVREDGEFSFAGQYATYLNVDRDDIIKRYKEVVASLFTPRAIFYYKTKGLSEDELVMAVGVLRMIDAMSAGVVYSNDPNDPDKKVIVINALLGLGKSVVDGRADPDTYIIEKSTGKILEKDIKIKNTMLVCNDETGIREISVPNFPGSEQCITDEQITELYKHAISLEKYYGRPQDIEWTVDYRGRMYILQTRTLKIVDSQSSVKGIPKEVQGYKNLLNKGVIACKGVGYGKAFLLRDEKELKNVPEGAVLIARHTNTKFVKVMNRTSAIITDIGGVTGHMASLSREYQVPTILNTKTATDIIENGQEITVDAINCNVYAGRVDALIEYSQKKRARFKEAHLYKKLEKAIKWISPLSLIDPDKEYFNPESCRTFHDITRFAHETAMDEIFQTGKGFEIDGLEDFMSAIAFAESGETKDIELQSTILKLDIPVEARLIDIDGGLRKRRKKASPGDVTSVPFSAFLKGLTAMRWPGPTPGGGVGSAAQVSSLSKEQLRKTREKSYAIISGNHMNFSIRLGFHFSMVEAYAGKNINDNYVKFFFKGGGAAIDRRARRVRLIKEILEAMGFRVRVIEDCVDAIVTKYGQTDIEKILVVMGKFTVYTKQLDMAMFNDEVTDMFIEDFIRDHVKPYSF